MYTRYQTTSRGINAYIQKSVRVDGRSKTITVKCLGLLSEIQKREGCADPRQWVEDLCERLTREEREARKCVTIEVSPSKEIPKGERPLRQGGDLMLLGLYNRLGLPAICRAIQDGGRTKYDLNEILRTLVCSRILFPCSKKKTLEQAAGYVKPPRFKEEEMFKALSLLSGHIDAIQAQVYRNSLKIMDRRDRMVFYDCTNYYFEIEDNDPYRVDAETGEVIPGLRKAGKSKEHRPNPIVQMGLFMDYDGIPLVFKIFPGNESEQTSLQPLEEVLNRRFGMTDYVVSTDAGLASEGNRRYNMAEGRDYICVQSIPSLPKADQKLCTDPKGWRIAFRKESESRTPVDPDDPAREIFDLSQVLEAAKDNPAHLRHTTFYKEILIEKKQDGEGTRKERVIVTYDHDFALYLKHKRSQQLERASKMGEKKQTRSRQSQQDPRHFITTIHKTKKGDRAVKVEMAINDVVVAKEEALDGFYAYGTSLDDDALDVLRIRSYHHEIEHIFRTTKTFLDARPVYLSRQDRIRSHFLVCFLAMVILKMLQRQIQDANKAHYKGNPLPVDTLVETLRGLRFGLVEGHGYLPMFNRTALTDQMQQLIGANLSTEIIPTRRMNAYYRNVGIIPSNVK